MLLLMIGLACQRPAPDSGDSSASQLRALPQELAFDGGAGLLLPYDVVVDGPRKLAYVSSVGQARVARVDLESMRLDEVLDIEGFSPTFPRLAVDGAGGLWIANGRGAWGIQGDRDFALSPEMRRSSDVVGLDEGAVFGGENGDGEKVLRRVDAAGELVQEQPTDGLVRALSRTEEGLAALVISPDGAASIQLFDVDGLVLVQECASPAGGEHLVSVQDGFVITGPTSTALVRCDGSSELVLQGRENHEALVLDDGVLVLDRLGDTVWGVARRYDDELKGIDETPTAKNTGFGDWDPHNERFWLNSEGTAEIVGFAEGIQGSIKLGHHAGEVTAHPTLEGVAYVSGRLSGNLQRADLNTGEFTHANQEMIWPVAPAIHGDRLFVVDGLLGEIWEIDPDTLETRTVLTDSLGTNPFLLMPDLTISGSGSLLLSHGPDNALLEIDPDTGQVLSSWALGGLPPASPDAAGKLEVLLSSVYDEVAFVGRLTDGVISRVDMGTGEVLSTTLGPAQLELLSHTPWGALFEDEELLHVGNTALDSRDLSPVPGRDLGLSVPLSSHPSGHIGWQRDGGRLVLRSPDGSITTLAELDYDGEQEPSLAWGSWEQPALLWVGFGVSGLRALRLVED